MDDPLWGRVDVAQWQQTPCLRGRLGVEQDVKDGRAVFYLVPAVVIQSERADHKHYIGYRPISGGNGLCILSEVELLSEPDARFHQQT